MRSTRVPEGRGSTQRPVIFLVLITVVLVAGLAVTYFTQGFGSLAAETTAAKDSATVVQPAPETPDTLQTSQTSAPVATSVPAPAPTSVPKLKATSAPSPTSPPVRRPVSTPAVSSAPVVEVKPEPVTTASQESDLLDSDGNLDFLPEVKFGEVLGEGLVELKMPGGDLVDTWYTFQVDTKTGDITVFFALYDEAERSVLSTVQVADYAKGTDLKGAVVALYYEDGSERIVEFDGAAGSMYLTQLYKVPFGPSMFSPDLRRSMVYYGMELQDDTGNISMELHLDISGLSESEKMSFRQSAPSEVEAALAELRLLVEQIEEKRLN